MATKRIRDYKGTKKREKKESKLLTFFKNAGIVLGVGATALGLWKAIDTLYAKNRQLQKEITELELKKANADSATASYVLQTEKVKTQNIIQSKQLQELNARAMIDIEKFRYKTEVENRKVAQMDSAKWASAHEINRIELKAKEDDYNRELEEKRQSEKIGEYLMLMDARDSIINYRNYYRYLPVLIESLEKSMSIDDADFIVGAILESLSKAVDISYTNYVDKKLEKFLSGYEKYSSEGPSREQLVYWKRESHKYLSDHIVSASKQFGECYLEFSEKHFNKIESNSPETDRFLVLAKARSRPDHAEKLFENLLYSKKASKTEDILYYFVYGKLIKDFLNGYTNKRLYGLNNVIGLESRYDYLVTNTKSLRIEFARTHWPDAVKNLGNTNEKYLADELDKSLDFLECEALMYSLRRIQSFRHIIRSVESILLIGEFEME